MDFVWNETIGEQIRAATDRALKGQVEDMREAAGRFTQQANLRERQAASRQASLSQIASQTGREAERAAIAQIREEVDQLRKAAGQLNDGADRLESKASSVNRLYIEMHRKAQYEDGRYASEIASIKRQISEYTARMRSITESINLGTFDANAPITTSPVRIGGNLHHQQTAHRDASLRIAGMTDLTPLRHCGGR